MYGPNPKRAIEKVENPEPEKIDKYWKSWLELKNSANLAESIPGSGTEAIRRVNANNPKTIKAFLRNVASVKTRLNVFCISYGFRLPQIHQPFQVLILQIQTL